MKTPVRVLHVHAGNLYGGIERVLVTLARERHHAPAMAPAFALCYDDRAAKELAASGCPVHLLEPTRASRPWTVWRARQRLRQVIAEGEADLVVTHSPWGHAMFAPAIRASGRASLYWLHGAVDGRHWLERRASRTPPAMAICNSRYTQGTLPALFPDVPCAVVHNPAAPPPADASRRRGEIRAALRAPPECAVIVQVSRIDPAKGQDQLIAALARMNDVPGWRCWIVGGAPDAAATSYLERLRGDARGAGIGERVDFLGERSDTAELLAAADVFCQPNVTPEGFGMTFVEALYAGLPVVTTEIGGAVEVVDGTCGVLVRPRDTPQLAAVLSRLVRDPAQRRALGAAGPARASALCDPARQLARVASIAESVARRGAP